MKAEISLGPHFVVLTSPFRAFIAPRKNFLIILAALVAGLTICTLPPVNPLGANGMYFLATMVVAVTLWVLEVFDEYIVGLMLLLSWVVFGIVPAKFALAGFSENSWFFTVGALGIAAAIGKTSLLQRLALRLLHWIPIQCQKTYTLFLLSAGVLSDPLLPTGKARVEVLFSRALMIVMRHLGPETPGVAVASRELAETHRRRGSLETASLFLAYARDIADKTLPADHPDALLIRITAESLERGNLPAATQQNAALP